MNKRRIARVIALATIIASTAVFARTLISSAFYAPEPEAPTVGYTASYATAEAALPLRLVIPALDIDAEVEHVGINYKGDMAAPADYDDVAWYARGTIPGEKGSAVMAGHLNDGLGLSGVFQDLQKIAPGDEMYVENAEGGRKRFVVERIEVYDYRSVPLEEVFQRSDAARLNLITCGGRWTWDGETYDKRVVVYAKMIE